MDYTVKVNGLDVDITIESNNVNCHEDEKHSQRNRLLAYYQDLLKIKGISPESEQYKALNYLVNNLTEQNAKEKIDDFEKRRVNRLLAYMTKIARLKMKKEAPEEEQEITSKDYEKMEKMADALVEVLDATYEDMQEGQETLEINGNKFLYNKNDLNIKEYLTKLYDIGEQIKGNTWTVYCDEEGELVIY